MPLGWVCLQRSVVRSRKHGRLSNFDGHPDGLLRPVRKEAVMILSRPASLRQTGPPCAGKAARMSLWLLAALACGSTRLYSQEAADKVLVDKQTLQTLLQRVDELEARVKQLETGGQPQAKNGEAFSAGMLSASAVPS